MADIGWGHLKKNAEYGLPFDSKSDFQEVDFAESREIFSKYMHAAHAMIYMKDDASLWNLFPKRGSVLVRPV